MDPDAALARYWSAIEEGDAVEARAAYGDLFQWMEGGGFEPNWKASGHTKAAFMKSPGATLRAKHGSPHGTGRARGLMDRGGRSNTITAKELLAGIPRRSR